MTAIREAARFVILILIPSLVLLRASYRGFLSGLLVRLPGKLFVIGSLAVLTSWSLSEPSCGYGFATARFNDVFVVSFVVIMYCARRFHFEGQLELICRRERWFATLRVLDGIGGAVLELLAAAVILSIAYGFLHFPNSTVLELTAPWPKPEHPAFFEGLEFIRKHYAYVTGSCAQYHDVYLDFLGLPLVAFYPVCFTLAFESFLFWLTIFTKHDQLPNMCQDCGGYGVYGLHKSLLVASTCRKCLGTGEIEVDQQKLMDSSLKSDRITLLLGPAGIVGLSWANLIIFLIFWLVAHLLL